MATETFPVGTYFYPQTTACPERNKRAFDAGFAPVREMVLAGNAKPLFEGHDQPRTYCLVDNGDPITKWDDSNPLTLAVQANMMREALLDFLIIDSYAGIRNGNPVREMQAPIDAFFSLSDREGGSREKLKAGFMWCIEGPRVMLPVPPKKDLRSEPMRAYTYSVDTAKIIAEITSRYINNDGYFLVDSRPYMGIFPSSKPPQDGELFMADFIHEVREHANRLGFDPYLVGVERRGLLEKGELIFGPGTVDGRSAYALLADYRVGAESIQHYNERIESARLAWKDTVEATKEPFVPPVVAGCDGTGRGTPGATLDELEDKYPYVPIIPDATASAYGDMLESAMNHTQTNVPPTERYTPVCAWNEVAGACSILPRIMPDGRINDDLLRTTREVVNLYRHPTA